MPRPSLRGILVFALLAALALPYLGSPTSRLFSGVHAAGAPPSGADGANVPVTGITAADAASATPTTSATMAASDTPGTTTPSPSSTPASSATPTGSTTPAPTNTATPFVFPTVGINSTLVISPAGGPPGSTVALHAPVGSFPANIPATVVFQDATNFNPNVTIASGLIVNGDGSFNTSVILPAHATAGYARITVTAGTAALSNIVVVTPIITPNPPIVAPGGTVTLTGEGFAANNAIVFSLGTSSINATTPITSDQLGHFAATIAIPATQPQGAVAINASGATIPGAVVNTATVALQINAAAGTASVTATTTGTQGVAPGITNTPTLLPTAPPIRSQTPIGSTSGTAAYFAEGYTGQATTNGKASFSETLTILNPTTSAAAVTITYYIQGATQPVVVQRSVGPQSTLREPVNTDVGPDKIVAAMVTSSQRVRVSRTILRTGAHNQRLAGSTTQPATAPNTTWGFPEGYTGISFQEYLTILNPGTSQATVTVRLAPQAASAAGARTITVTVPAHGRSTSNIRSLNQGNNTRSVGMLVSSTVPIVAERVEYFGDGSGSSKFGSTVTPGIVAPSAQLRIAYGASGGTTTDAKHQVQPAGDQDYITLLNPNTTGGPVTVTAAFADGAGHALGKPTTVSVASGTRQTIAVNAVLGSKPVAPFSATLSASAPIMAEAAQYYGGSPNVGTHPGVTFPAMSSASADALLAGLGTALSDGSAIHRTLYLYNPGTTPVQVHITYFGSTGKTASATYTVPANGIATANVNADTQSAFSAGPVGAEITSAVGGFVALALGQTADGLTALPDVGTAAS